MKRSRSALTLRNLAMSIKQSIQLDEQKTAKKQARTLKASKSQAHGMPKERNSQFIRIDKPLNRQQKQNRIFVLEKQIAILEKQLKQKENCEKDHAKELQQYDDISKAQLQSEREINCEKMVNEQLKNQILMLQEDIFSIHFNIESQIAQKQYHEELIQAYQHQYEAQSKLVMKIQKLQQQNQKNKNEIQNIQQSISKSKWALQEWKDDIKFDLNQHKLKNNIKIIRTKLISLQDKCDSHCNQNNLRKIRQLYCLYFKNYSKQNQISNDEVEMGIDIFICKNKLSEDFSEFLRERLIYNKPKFELIQEYISTLQKMEEIYRKSIFQSSKKLHQQFIQGLSHFQQRKQEKINQIIQNSNQIKKMVDQIDELFNNESIAIIEYMREKNQNTYNLKEIKQKLRENKRQQKNRIQKIKQSYNRIKQLQNASERYNPSNTINSNKLQIEQLSQHLISSQLHLEQLERKYFRLLKDKNTVQQKINQAITKWREIDQKKTRLKNLYKQLQASNQARYEYDNQILPKSYQQPTYKHSKNTSLGSLNQSKSILSLSNPYKKMMEKSTQIYQPILTSCQMILSNKLNSKDHNFKCYASSTNKLLKDKTNLVQTQSKTKVNKYLVDKQNNKSLTKHKKQTIITPAKGKIIGTQRQSLSRLIISRFNR